MDKTTLFKAEVSKYCMSLSKMPLHGKEVQSRDIILQLVHIRDIPSTEITEQASVPPSTPPSTSIVVADVSNGVSSNT